MIRRTILSLLAVAVVFLATPALAQQVPIISHMDVDLTGPLTAGQTLRVTLDGWPGGLATFDVGAHQRLPMHERSPGIYVGRYTVTIYDNDPYTPVVGHLEVPDGRFASLTSWSTVAMAGAHSPGLTIVPNSTLIYSAVHNGTRTIVPGQTVTVTMVGQPGGVGSFDIGIHPGIPMVEWSPGNYTGSFTAGEGPIEPRALVTVHLNMPDGEVADRIVPPSVAIYP